MLKKWNRWLLTSRKDRFFDFNMIDQSIDRNQILENLKKIDFLRDDLIDYRKID